MTETGISPKTSKEWIDLASRVLTIEREGLAAVQAALGPDFVTALGWMATCTGRVVITGIGKSGLVGRKIAATLSSTGTPAFFLHPVEGAHGDLGMIRPEDVVVAISYSGETDELNAILPTLKGLVHRIIALTGNTDSTMAGLADVSLCVKVPREACPMGLAPTASTTATLALGDALAVCLIEWKSFDACDFKRYHPGGALGQRLSTKVAELMHHPEMVTVRTGTPLALALTVLNKGGFGTVVVVDGRDHLQGILTDGDVRRMVCADELDPDKPIEECMVAHPLKGTPDQPAAEVLDLMESREITVLPIVDNNMVLKGIVHMHDLLGKGRLRFASIRPS
ncbi:KpsF/GutQ family sugar-phosphate isomerase [Desulfoplanes formicivorans]|uniref:Arabinose 5-phosphate isomerase n=1 Tax=Desulfoplanes formicivorans TaxID=1592317 RepID=A0A194AF27_9BACT|nr:KpsF/GutQ family sugar-phosphate isomerase [Desulfoplanes formicivorans]GAU08672.1 arabinose 5-phosphate isomerase [Desulfoplanes formicivorans]